jgi:hypothetical protein
MARVENLLLYSGRFDQTAWVKSASLAPLSSTFSASSPTKRVSTWRVTATSSPNLGQRADKAYRAPGARYVASVWLQPQFHSGPMRLVLQDTPTETSRIDMWFDPIKMILKGITGTPSPSGRSWSQPEAGFEALADGWYRVWLAATLTTATQADNGITVRLYTDLPATVGWVMTIGGIQLSRADTLSSYYVETNNTVVFGVSYDPFDFPFHTFSTIYPDNSTRVQLGKSYIFTSRPQGPPQRIFKLRFEGMRWFLTSEGLRDISTMPQHNLARMEDFYRGVELWKSFLWNHPLEGTKTVRFNKPLEIPEQIKGGSGVVNPFDIELLEQP